jgi:hypothetical protein
MTDTSSVPAGSTTGTGTALGDQGQDDDQPSVFELARQRAGQPWVMGAGKLTRLALLAGAGLRVLLGAPGAGTAVAAWLILTAAGTAWQYLRWSRAGEPALPAGAWQPGHGSRASRSPTACRPPPPTPPKGTWPQSRPGCGAAPGWRSPGAPTRYATAGVGHRVPGDRRGQP